MVHNRGKSTAHDCEATVKVIIPSDEILGNFLLMMSKS